MSIPGYNLFRKDRPIRRGGGVCIYLTESIRADHQTVIENDNFECLWLWLRPNRLPRPLCLIALCVVYHPPGLSQDDHQCLKKYLTYTIDLLRNRYPNCGIILLGDFNDWKISLLLAIHNLKQVVKAPTRGTSILDLILTNLSSYFSTPQLLPPLGSSDHNVLRWVPSTETSYRPSGTKFIKHSIRRFPQSSINAFGKWASTFECFGKITADNTLDHLASCFSLQISQAIDHFFLLK